MPRNDRPKAQRIISALTTAVIHAPRAPARPWLTTVAAKMPRMIGTGFLKRAAKMKARSCVLSPISAKATTPVETKRDSIQDVQAGLQTIDHHASPAKIGGVVVKGLAKLNNR